MTTYEIITRNESTIIKRTTDDGVISWIPTDLSNSDYQEYLKTLEESSN